MTDPAAGPTSSPPDVTSAEPLHQDAASRRRQHRAWYVYDWANSAYVTTTATVLLGPYLTAVARADACPNLAEGVDCTESLRVLGVPISAGSLVFYAVTLSTVVSAVILPLVGAIADRSRHQRQLLGGFAWIGALAAASMFFVTGSNWQLGVGLLLVANTALGSSLVVYDAILCQIATPDERDGVSSRGWAMGYLGGFLLLAANLALVTLHDSLGLTEGQAVRVSLLSAGVWWGAFTLVPVLGLRNRVPVDPVLVEPVPVESIPAEPVPVEPGTGVDVGKPPATAAASPTPPRASLLKGSFTQLADTLRHLRGYRNTWMFLLAYLLFNDGIQTVIGASSVYGAEELGLPTESLIITILMVQLVAFGGALLFGRLAGRYGAKRTILAGLVLWTVVVVVGFFLPAGNFPLFLALAGLIGLVLGGTQALSRSLFSQLVPLGREAEYFSLYQAAERGTSWFGTFLFGLVYQLSGSYRPAIVSLVVFFVLGGLLLTRVRIREGIVAAGNTPPAVL